MGYSIKQAVQRFKNIENLYIDSASDCYRSPNDAIISDGMSLLKYLILNDLSISNATLIHIAKYCQELQYLEMDRKYILNFIHLFCIVISIRIHI